MNMSKIATTVITASIGWFAGLALYHYISGTGKMKAQPAQAEEVKTEEEGE